MILFFSQTVTILLFGTGVKLQQVMIRLAFIEIVCAE